jgi:deoxyribodipyrimidine photolyase-related protein
MDTVWVFGDQLNRRIASLVDLEPGAARILMIESRARARSKAWHRQRLHLVLASMRRFAAELRRAGFEVDYRSAKSFGEGLAAHRRRYRPKRVRAMEPCSWDAVQLLSHLDVEVLPSNQFLCHYREFAGWASGRKTLRMEDFYRWQRTRLGYLMKGGEPAGGRWNFDAENREPPPRHGTPWPRPPLSRLDRLDAQVLADLPEGLVGSRPTGLWATSRRGALARLRDFVEKRLPSFGPHQDSMIEASWHLGHSLLSPYLNLGLLLPGEVCDAAERAWREGKAPLASVEGFVRQVIGWREYVWGLYWQWMPQYRDSNQLGAVRPLPPLFRDPSRTQMRCVAEAVRGVHHRAYAHHIQRLMVLGNLGLTAGVEPRALVDWMWGSFIDGAEWVMLPNVIGMALYADGGRMSTKPYAAGGAYIHRMSDHCGQCDFDPRERVGAEACPFTSLYWAFIDRHRERLLRNHRTATQVRALERLADLPEVRKRAEEVLARLDRGEL